MRNVIVNGLAFLVLDDGALFPVLQGAKGGAPAPAAPTPEERRLQGIQATAAEEQLKLARAQQAENDALTPILLQEYGLTRRETVSQADPRVATLRAERDQLAKTIRPAQTVALPGRRGTTQVVDPASRSAQARVAAIDKELAGLDQGGKTTISYEKTPNAAAKKREEIEGMQLDRSLKALKGELPVTATLAKELELGKRTLAEKMSKQLGAGWETSSAGIQAQAEYDRMATSLKEAEQRDQLTTAEALSINRQNSRASNTQGTFDTSTMGRVGAANLLRGAGGSGGDALSYFGTLRNQALEAKRMKSDEIGGYVAGGMGLVGTGVGVGAALLI